MVEEPGTGRIGDLFHRGRHPAVRPLSPMRESLKIILCAHGYRTNSLKDFAGVARWLHENNCDLLTIDQRGCGKSGGEYITFGAREKYDVLDWLDFVGKHNEEHVGLSVWRVDGRRTVSCASGLTLPPNVRG